MRSEIDKEERRQEEGEAEYVKVFQNKPRWKCFYGGAFRQVLTFSIKMIEVGRSGDFLPKQV